MKLMTLALLHLVGTSMVRTRMQWVDVGKMGRNSGMEEEGWEAIGNGGGLQGVKYSSGECCL